MLHVILDCRRWLCVFETNLVRLKRSGFGSGCGSQERMDFVAQQFSPESRSRALGLLAERQRLGEGESAWVSCQAVALCLGA